MAKIVKAEDRHPITSEMDTDRESDALTRENFYSQI